MRPIIDRAAPVLQPSREAMALAAQVIAGRVRRDVAVERLTEAEVRRLLPRRRAR